MEMLNSRIIVIYVLIMLPFLLLITLNTVDKYINTPKALSSIANEIEVKRYKKTQYYVMAAKNDLNAVRYVREILPEMNEIVREDATNNHHPIRLFAIQLHGDLEIVLVDLRSLSILERTNLMRHSTVEAIYLRNDALKTKI